MGDKYLKIVFCSNDRHWYHGLENEVVKYSYINDEFQAVIPKEEVQRLVGQNFIGYIYPLEYQLGKMEFVPNL